MKAVRVLLAAAALMLLCQASGCTFFHQEALPVSADAATFLPVVDETPEATETPVPRNPLAIFYNAYESAVQPFLDKFSSYLTGSNNIDSLNALMLLSEHESILTKAKAGVARLTSDGSGFSDTLIGAASGSGSLQQKGDAYRMTFSYADGSLLRGYLTEDSLRFSVYDKTGLIRCSASLQKGNGLWLSCVEEGETRTVLLITNKVRFALVPIPVSEEIYLLPTATPRPADESYTPYSPMTASPDPEAPQEDAPRSTATPVPDVAPTTPEPTPAPLLFWSELTQNASAIFTYPPQSPAAESIDEE